MEPLGNKNATSQGADRRRHRRFPCEGYAEVVCRYPTVLFRGRIRDISLTGCFIETAVRVRLDRLTEVELRFTALGRHVSSVARVMDIRPGKGAGFEFLPGNRGMQEAFVKLIESLTDSADALRADPPTPKLASAIGGSRR